MDVRVATFNIRTSRAFDGLHSWPLRRHVAVAAIHRLDADIIGVQELHARPRAFLLGHLAEYDAAGEGRDRNGRGEQCALLARTARFTIGEHRTRWFGSTPDRPGSRLPGAGAPRIVTTATLRDIHHGVEIDVWNTHLDERRAVNRVRSAEQLAAWVRADRPTIVVGDFNAERDDRDVFRPLERRGLRFAQPDAEGGTAHGFRIGRDGPRIDHILVSHHWDVIGVETVRSPSGERPPSDHWPVRAALHLRTP